MSTNLLWTLIIGTVLAAAWITLLIIGTSRYNAYLDELSLSDYKLKWIYPIGLYLLDLVNYDFRTKRDRKKLQQCKALYGKENFEYFFRVHYAAKISVVFTMIIVTVFIYPLTGKLENIVVGLFLIAISYFIIDDSVVDAYNKREESLLRDFPAALSKLTLLINAGMIIKDAWIKVSESGEGVLFEEMRTTNDQVENGMSQVEAFIDFGSRCGVSKIKKISSVFAQTLTKGNSELIEYLQLASKEMWEEKKHLVKRQGEKASSKLLIPIGLMFLGILALIGIPMISNLNV